MATEKTELTDLLVYGVDMKSRTVYFGTHLDLGEETPGDFTQASIEVAIRAMHRMVQEAPGKPITIQMNSYGGSPYDMLRLYDEILSCPCQIKFFGGGNIMSAATWVMVACDERYLYPHATIMVHDGWSGIEGKHTDVQIQAAEDVRLQNILYDIYAANSRMPKEFWEDMCQRDLYMSASEAVSLGLADKVIEPKKRGNLRKLRQAAMKKAPTKEEMQSLVDSMYARINKVKVPKIELNPVVKEPTDPNVVIAAEIEKPQQSETTGVTTDSTEKN